MRKGFTPGPFQRTMEKILDGSRRALQVPWKTDFKDFKYTRIGNRRYVLNGDAFCETPLLGCAAQITRRGEANPIIVLTQEGTIRIHRGYTWDGPSGPTFDTKDSLIGSLFHDALYELHDAGKLPDGWRHRVDALAVHIWKTDGMYGWRADAWGKALEKFAGLYWRK